MSIRQAVLSDLDRVQYISEVTISEIYPHYYPKGAVDFFLGHHSEDNILSDIEMIGTITIKQNEICRLFVLPSRQGMGVGTELLDFAEKIISCQYSKIVLDASLPAKQIYLKRGYKETEFNIILTRDNDFLCYDVMERQV